MEVEVASEADLVEATVGEVVMAVATMGAATMWEVIMAVVVMLAAGTVVDAAGTAAGMEATEEGLASIMVNPGTMGRLTIIIPIIIRHQLLSYPPRRLFISSKAEPKSLPLTQNGDIVKIQRVIIPMSKSVQRAGKRLHHNLRAWNPITGIIATIPKATILMSGNVRQRGNR